MADKPADLYREAYAHYAQEDYLHAESLCLQVLEHDSNHLESLVLLGFSALKQECYEEAIRTLSQVLIQAPHIIEVHINLAIAYRGLGELDEARTILEQARQLDANNPTLLHQLAAVLFRQQEWEQALACYRQLLTIERGQPWHEGEEKGPSSPLLRQDSLSSRFKLVHDLEQFEHLMKTGALPASFTSVMAAYRTMLTELFPSTGDTSHHELTEAQQDLLYHTYNRALHVEAAPQLTTSALQPLDRKKIESDYTHNEPGVTYFDKLLTPRALASLRKFCLESTVWSSLQRGHNYLGAYMQNGFTCGLLFQVAEELRQALPGIFQGHQLTQMWAFKYGTGLDGIQLHADAAAINVNFWITPDEANNDPATGGLVVYKDEAPKDWDFKDYNNNAAAITSYLEAKQSESVRVPHRQNRAVIFNSDLFHHTDSIQFKPGYENRRINITMLYGLR